MKPRLTIGAFVIALICTLLVSLGAPSASATTSKAQQHQATATAAKAATKKVPYVNIWLKRKILLKSNGTVRRQAIVVFHNKWKHAVTIRTGGPHWVGNPVKVAPGRNVRIYTKRHPRMWWYVTGPPLDVYGNINTRSGYVAYPTR